jgi:DNA-binding transcriptional LysR family regulator
MSSTCKAIIEGITGVNELRTDLNLLHIVHAVIAERSVTRAARRLKLTQPAVSNALRRARALFQDELLVKATTGMRPTERALAIWPGLDAALEQIAGLTRTQRFQPATTTLTFRIAITAALEASLVPRLAIRFAQEAPHALLCFQPHTNQRSITDLEQGRLDCAVGMFANPPDTLMMRGVLRDEHVCVSRAGPPMTLERFSACRHLLVTPSARPTGLIDTWLAMHGHTRQIVMIVNRYEDALRIVRETDLVTVIPRIFAEAHAEGMQISPLPFDADQLLFKLLWHDRTDKAPPHVWFREMVAGVLE